MFQPDRVLISVLCRINFRVFIFKVEYLLLNLHHLIHFPSQILDEQEIDKRFVMALSWLAIANAIKIFRHWLSITWE